MTTVRDLWIKAEKMKLEGEPWPHIREKLIERGRDSGFSHENDLGDRRSYELLFETGEKIRFDGDHYCYERARGTSA